MIAIRRAVPADAEAISAVLTASITALCVADHKGDPVALASWLANKGPEGVGAWFANPANTVLVAERNGEIAACGAFNKERKIILNYVSPRHRFAGVSKALLGAMEAALGPGYAHLDSTLTARDFYLGAGWQEAGLPEPYRHVAGYPMRKLLA